MIKVIADPGSCHMGSLERAYDLTRAAVDAGCDAIKWQLFKGDEGGNVPLPYEWFGSLVAQGRALNVEVFASVWDEGGLSLIDVFKCKCVKFAYSQNRSAWIHSALRMWKTTYISGNTATPFPDNFRVSKLLCVPEYPVKYLIDFDGLFPRFDGFSSHCLGIEQDKAAIRAGAKIIEKHFQLDDNLSTCPDGAFAIRPAKLKELCDYAHSYEGLMQ